MALRMIGSAFRSIVTSQMSRIAFPEPAPLLAIKDRLIGPGQDLQPSRSVTYYSHNQGTRRNVKAASLRFFRLHWGGWIRPRMGRYKRLWKKPWEHRWWSRQHVLLNRQESLMLERMVLPEIKKPRYFVDDPYGPYHKRHGFDMVPRNKYTSSQSYIKLMYDY